MQHLKTVSVTPSGIACAFLQKRSEKSVCYNGAINRQGGGQTGAEVKLHNVDGYNALKSLKPHEKYNLTIKEAAAYFSIGEKKLRSIVDENYDADFILMNGSHVLLKRAAFERYIDKLLSI